jgi:hypothetical protein
MQKAVFLIFCGLILAGCEKLGIETPGQSAAAIREAEGRAIGGACRHSGRALEDCYNLNTKASKPAVFNGWRDMDTYMRENNIEIVQPVIPIPSPKKKKKKGDADAPADTETPAQPAQKDEAVRSDGISPPGAGARMV